MASVTLTVNGKRRRVDAAPETPLLWILRDSLQLTGTKYGCGSGLCGACTVHLDGQAVRSCSTRIGEVAGKRITTIEGLAADKQHPVLRAWLAEQVPQCGYCQPGQIMTVAALAARNPRPTSAEIEAALDGVLCRCGTYLRIRRAVRRVLRRRRRTMSLQKMTRRDFIQVAAAAGGGFVLALHLPLREELLALPVPKSFAPNFWLRIDPDGIVTVTVHRSELGQGARTALPMIVAEELEADWSKIRIEQAVADPKYGSMTTGGSIERAHVVGAAAQGGRHGARDADRRRRTHLERGSRRLPRREGYGRARADGPPARLRRSSRRPPPRCPRPRTRRSRIRRTSPFSANACRDSTSRRRWTAVPLFGIDLVRAGDACRHAGALPGLRRPGEIVRRRAPHAPCRACVTSSRCRAVSPWWPTRPGRRYRGARRSRSSGTKGRDAALDSAAIRTLFAAKMDEPAQVVRHEGDAARGARRRRETRRGRRTNCRSWRTRRSSR